MACIVCNAERWCNSSCTCFGCRVRDKDISINGETVAGHTFGRKPLILTDNVKDQRADAYEQWSKISQAMQQGGAVAEDAFQQPCEIQRERMESTVDWEKPLDKWNKLEKQALGA